MSTNGSIYLGNKFFYDTVRSPAYTGMETYQKSETLGDTRRLEYPWREHYQGELFKNLYPEQAKPYIETAAPQHWRHNLDGTPLRLGFCSGLADIGHSVMSASYPDYSLPPPQHVTNSEYKHLPAEPHREADPMGCPTYTFMRRRTYDNTKRQSTARTSNKNTITDKLENNSSKPSQFSVPGRLSTGRQPTMRGSNRPPSLLEHREMGNNNDTYYRPRGIDKAQEGFAKTQLGKTFHQPQTRKVTKSLEVTTSYPSTFSSTAHQEIW